MTPKEAIQAQIKDLLDKAATDRSALGIVGLGQVVLASELYAQIAQAQIPEPALPEQECATTDCHGHAEHECPACHKIYCDDCHDLFLPIDPAFWVKTAMMCSQCHYSSHVSMRG